MFRNPFCAPGCWPSPAFPLSRGRRRRPSSARSPRTGSADPPAGSRADEGPRRTRQDRRRAAGAAAVRAGDHRGAKTDDGIFKVHRIGETLFYEIPKAQLGKDFLWNTQIKKTTLGAGYGGQAVGSRVVRWVQQGRSRPAAQHRLQRRRRPSQPDRAGGGRRELPGDHPGLQRRGVQPGGRSGHRRHAALHDRRAGVLGARPHRRPRLSTRTRSFLEKAVSFPENINVEVTQTFTAATRRRRPAADAARRRGARGMRGIERHGADAPQHGEAAREADDAAALRRARRLLHAGRSPTTAPTSTARSPSGTSRATGSRRRTRTRRSPSR